MNKLQKYQRENCTYRFIFQGMLISSGIKNKTNVIFITCNSLSDASEAISNRKLHKALGVRNLDQIEDWDKIKGVSNWLNVSMTDFDQPLNTDYFFVLRWGRESNKFCR